MLDLARRARSTLLMYIRAAKVCSSVVSCARLKAVRRLLQLRASEQSELTCATSDCSEAGGGGGTGAGRGSSGPGRRISCMRKEVGFFSPIRVAVAAM